MDGTREYIIIRSSSIIFKLIISQQMRTAVATGEYKYIGCHMWPHPFSTLYYGCGC